MLWSSCADQRMTNSDRTSLLFDAQGSLDTSRLQVSGLDYQLINTEGGEGLRIRTNEEVKGQFLTLRSAANQPWELGDTWQVQAVVSNIGSEPMQAEMFVGNDPDGLVRWYCSDYIDLVPGQTDTITVNLAWTPWINEPTVPLVGMRGAPGMTKTDLAKIQSIQFRPRYATRETVFVLHDVWAVGSLQSHSSESFLPFIDSFGQYKHQDWPSKTHSTQELKDNYTQEIETMSASKSGWIFDPYGGYAQGPLRKATGFFRVEKYEGKWWMVDPEGRLFWSNGLNCVNANMTLTGIDGREDYFEGLPTELEPLGQFYRAGTWASHGFYKDKIPFQAYSFLEANLYRTFGDTWKEEFLDLTHRRMRYWGMNTLGNVSDAQLKAQQRTPYVGTVWIRNTPKIEGSEGFWGKFHDVFDPAFRLAVRDNMASQRQGAGDPWCMGFFVDNEMSWGLKGSLAIAALHSPATQASKIEFVKDLQEKYIDIKALNGAWKTDYASWQDLLIRQEHEGLENAQSDLNAFYGKIAETYFRIVSEELHRIAPNQMYLGCRFAWANNDLTVAAAAEYCDIVSFNKYEYSIANLSLPTGIDRPIMIGEYHFGATDRGHTHPGVKVAKNQADRGHKYAEYIRGAIANPQIVGAHWFQYTDQAVTGREDGENYNVGFVTITNTPYQELVDSVRMVNHQMYQRRLGSTE